MADSSGDRKQVTRALAALHSDVCELRDFLYAVASRINDAGQGLPSPLDELLDIARSAASETKSLGSLIGEIYHLRQSKVDDGAALLTNMGFPGHSEALTKRIAQLMQKANDVSLWLFAAGRTNEKSQAQNVAEGDVATLQDYRALTEWAAENLKGKQRRVVELLAENNGKLALPDLNLACGWDGDQFGRCRQHVNRGIRKAGWLVERHDNEARLRQVKVRQK